MDSHDPSSHPRVRKWLRSYHEEIHLRVLQSRMWALLAFYRGTKALRLRSGSLWQCWRYKYYWHESIWMWCRALWRLVSMCVRLIRELYARNVRWCWKRHRHDSPSILWFFLSNRGSKLLNNQARSFSLWIILVKVFDTLYRNLKLINRPTDWE